MKHRKNLSLCVAAAFILLSGCETATPLDQTGEQTALTDSVPSSDSTAEPTDLESNPAPEPSEETGIDYEPFRGVEKDETPISTVNYKEFYPQIFCCDDDCVYFWWDGTVYKYDGETPEPLFERNALCLNCFGGKLYFLENGGVYSFYSMNMPHNEGLLSCYDLTTGEIRQLTEFEIGSPIVTEDGIFYTDYATVEDGDGVVTGICRLDEETGQSERLYDGMVYLEYSGFHLKHRFEAGDKAIFFREDEEYLLENVLPYRDCMVGDYYYYQSDTDHSLNRLSMLTGENVTLKPYQTYISDPVYDDPIDMDEFQCFDYTVLNDIIYFVDDHSGLRRYDESSDSCTRLESNCGFIYLYTDGKDLYAVGWDRSLMQMSPTYCFIKLTLDGNTAEGEILT